MSTSKRERKRFERWYKRHNPQGKHDFQRAPDSPFPYIDDRVNAAWHAWKASKRERESIFQAARRVVEMPDREFQQDLINALRNEFERYNHEEVANAD